MNEDEISAALDALDMIKSTLTRHSMRRPEQEMTEETGEAEPVMSIEIEAEPAEEEMPPEAAPPEESKPLSVMSYGTSRSAPPPRSSAPPPPVKRGRGRPRKVR